MDPSEDAERREDQERAGRASRGTPGVSRRGSRTRTALRRSPAGAPAGGRDRLPRDRSGDREAGGPLPRTPGAGRARRPPRGPPRPGPPSSPPPPFLPTTRSPPPTSPPPPPPTASPPARPPPPPPPP